MRGDVSPCFQYAVVSKYVEDFCQFILPTIILSSDVVHSVQYFVCLLIAF